MNLQDLRTLLDYHYWARDRVLDAASALAADQFSREIGGSFGSAVTGRFWSRGGWPYCVALIAAVQVLTIAMALMFWQPAPKAISATPPAAV